MHAHTKLTFPNHSNTIRMISQRSPFGEAAAIPTWFVNWTIENSYFSHSRKCEMIQQLCGTMLCAVPCRAVLSVFCSYMLALCFRFNTFICNTCGLSFCFRNYCWYFVRIPFGNKFPSKTYTRKVANCAFVRVISGALVKAMGKCVKMYLVA